MTTIMQPFHSDLQAQIQDTHRTTHTGTTTRCRTQRRNTFADETAQPPPRTHEVPFIAGRSHFTRKNTRFRAPASSPTQAPCNIHATITMRFAASRRKPARIYAHGNTRWQQSCSHSTAICKHRFKTRIELRTQEQPLVAEHRGGTHSRMKRPSCPPAHTRYLSSPAEATLHGKTQGFVLRLPPQYKPHATFMQPLQCVSQHHVANLHVLIYIYATHPPVLSHPSPRPATTPTGVASHLTPSVKISYAHMLYLHAGLVAPMQYITGYLHALFTAASNNPIRSIYNVLLPIKYLYSSHILASNKISCAIHTC